MTISSNLSPLGPRTPDERATELGKAARDFEALMISLILKTATESSMGGWLGTDRDQAGEQAMSLAQEQFACALAAGGGLGLASMVANSIGTSLDQTESRSQ
jgi:Rod binding domain-containing protein